MKKTYTYIALITLLAMAQLQGIAQDWNIQTIDPNADIRGTNIQLDNNSYPHVLYKEDNGTYDYLYYAHWNGIAWEIESAQNSRVGSSQFCLDQNNNPHIISMDVYYSPDKIYYTRRNGSGNLIVQTAISASSYEIISVYFRNGSLEFIAEQGNNMYQFIYNASNNTFANNYIGMLEGGYSFKSVIDNDGNVYFTYYDSGNTRFGFFDGTNVSSFLVAENAQFPSITLDNQDIPHISYYKSDTDDLIHAKLPAQAVKYLKSLKDKNVQTATNIEE